MHAAILRDLVMHAESDNEGPERLDIGQQHFITRDQCTCQLGLGTAVIIRDSILAPRLHPTDEGPHRAKFRRFRRFRRFRQLRHQTHQAPEVPR